MVKFQVNGQTQSFDGDPSMPLLWYLRDELGLTGTKYGCGVCVEPTLHMSREGRGCLLISRVTSAERVDEQRTPTHMSRAVGVHNARGRDAGAGLCG